MEEKKAAAVAKKTGTDVEELKITEKTQET